MTTSTINTTAAGRDAGPPIGGTPVQERLLLPVILGRVFEQAGGSEAETRELHRSHGEHVRPAMRRGGRTVQEMSGDHDTGHKDDDNGSQDAPPPARPSVPAQAHHVIHNHSMICAAAC